MNPVLEVPAQAAVRPSVAQPPRVGVVAGEASGDLLGSLLIEGLGQAGLNADFFGIAGPKMQAAGALIQPVPCLLGRTVGEHGGLFHQALLEADTLAVFQINGRNNQHGEFLRESAGESSGRSAESASLNDDQGRHSTKFLSSCRPSRALFSGWN